MKTTKILTICVTALGLMVFPAKPAGAAPMGTAFTYQGRLIDANKSADGLYDFQFKLFDDPNVVLGNQVGGDVNKPDVDVIDTHFTVELDFGSSVFDGNARWLEIGVRPGDSNDPNAFVTLSPRQEITPAPYALQTRGIFVDDAGNVGIGTMGPNVPLHVENTDGVQLALHDSSNPGWGFKKDRVGTNENLGLGRVSKDGTGYTEYVTFKEGGYIGIGTTSPEAKLDINGQIKIIGGSPGEGKVLTSNASGLGSWQTPTCNVAVPLELSGSVASPGAVISAINTDSGIGVYGRSDNAYGVHGQSDYLCGVWGKSHEGIGVWGASVNGDGVYGSSTNGYAGHFSGDVKISGGGNGLVFPDGTKQTTAASGAGGDNLGNHTATQNIRLNENWLSGDGGNEGIFVNSAGKVGIGTTSPSEKLDVAGWTLSTGLSAELIHTDQLGLRNPTTGYVRGVLSVDPDDNFNIATLGSGHLKLIGGNVGIGTPSPAYKLDVAGTTATDVLIIRGGADLAEPFSISDSGEIPKGALVVIDEENPGQLKLSDRPYDKRVAGVVSGAGGLNPGLTLSQQGIDDGGIHVALSGRVYALADSSNGPIKPGDMLTTSSIPGYAMKAIDKERAYGAVIGKAMTSLEQGRGLVLVLVNLQ